MDDFSFTPDVKSIISRAREEARSLKHTYIGTEHILLAMMAYGTGSAFQSLVTRGVTYEKVFSAVTFIVGLDGIPSPYDEKTLKVSPRALSVLSVAYEITHQYNLAKISDMVLLLAIIREGENIACGLLESMGISLPSFQKFIEESIQRGSPPTTDFRQGQLKFVIDAVTGIPLRELRDSLKADFGFTFVFEAAANRTAPELWPSIQERPYLIDLAKHIGHTMLRINEEMYGACPREDILVLMSKDEVAPTPHVFECPVCEFHFQELRARYLAYEAGTTPAAWFEDEEPPPVE